ARSVPPVLLNLRCSFLTYVLKFGYLTQLLSDSNYLPLALRLLNQQDFIQTVTTEIDHKDICFLNFRNLHSYSNP
ncbi:unnamed protein product, partial [Tuber aestivum]